MTERTNTITLVNVTEKLSISIPYISHKAVLTVAIINISKETSLVDFDLKVFITCGKKVVQDNAPATIPTISTLFID